MRPAVGRWSTPTACAAWIASPAILPLDARGGAQTASRRRSSISGPGSPLKTESGSNTIPLGEPMSEVASCKRLRGQQETPSERSAGSRVSSSAIELSDPSLRRHTPIPVRRGREQ